MSQIALYEKEPHPSPFHAPCRGRVAQARDDVSPAFVTWSICYEFLRVTTHARAPVAPWTLPEARGYIEALLASPGFEVLVATPRHAPSSRGPCPNCPICAAT